MSEKLPPPYDPSPERFKTQAARSPTGDSAQRGPVLQPWHEVSNILRNPALVVTSVTDTSKDKQFTIYDLSGNLVACIERDESRFSSRFIPGGPFALRVVDPKGRLLLTIRRPKSTTRPRLEIAVSDPRTGRYVGIGACQEKFHLFKRRYNLFAGSNCSKQFGRISVGSKSNSWAFENNAGAIVASIDRQWEVCDELSSRSNKFVIRMDPSTFSMAERRNPHLGAPLSLDQRAVLLATAVAIDVDCFTQRDDETIAGMDAGTWVAIMAASSASAAASANAAFCGPCC